MTATQNNAPSQFDPAPLRQLVDDLGAAAAERVVGMFLKMSTEYLKTIETHLHNKDAEGFKRAAHSLKSSAKALGGALIVAHALRMEQGGLPAADTLPELRQAVEEFCSILRAWRP
jgi:histidine phosphotransfer protein HptB